VLPNEVRVQAKTLNGHIVWRPADRLSQVLQV
jgi:hypothetical protein